MMGEIIYRGQSQKVKEGENVSSACELLGVPFGCKIGTCRACKVKVVSGMENFSQKTTAENQHDLRADERLMCQCILEKGVVTISR